MSVTTDELVTDTSAPVAAATTVTPFPRRHAVPDRLFGANWFTVSALLLGGLAPALLIGDTELAPQASVAWYGAWALSVATGVRYAWLVAVAPRRLFELIFWLFTYVFLGLAPLVQIRTAQYPDTTPAINPDLHVTSICIVAAGAVAFAVGILLGTPRSERGPDPEVPASRMVRTSQVIPYRLMALTFLALLLSTFYVMKIGPHQLFSSRVERGVAEQSAWGNFTIQAIVKSLATLPLVVCFAGLMQLRRQRKLTGGSGPFFLQWFVLAVLLVMVNPLTTPRYVAGTAILSALIALGAAATANRARFFALGLAVGLVLVFPYADRSRSPDTKSGQYDKGGPTKVLSSSDFDAFDQINNTVAYVQAEGHTDGEQLAGAAFFWVPRVVWENKPVDTGSLLATFRNYDLKNLSAPLWSEFYIDGGWLWLVIGMALLGFVVRRLDGRLTTAFSSEVGQGALLGSLPFYLILLLRGSLLEAMAGLSVLIACGLAVSKRRLSAIKT